MSVPIAEDIASIQAISSVPTILEVVAAITGLRFVCIARVTEDAWTTCAVLDRLGFGLNVGDGLDVATTLCERVRDTRKPVVIDHVSTDEVFRDHHTPRIYGFQSYISVPVLRPDSSYFGTLCALDPLPANLSGKGTVDTLMLFAELISKNLETQRQLTESENALLDERGTAELREQFIAVLGHDVRTPLASILLGTEIMQSEALSPRGADVLMRMRRSAMRISGLVSDVMDFTRGRMGRGIALELANETALPQLFEQVVSELRGEFPERAIELDMKLPRSVYCDGKRLQQMLSNLVKNALVHGDPLQPIVVRAALEDQHFTLCVINGGPQIPQATLAQLFKPFWRAQDRRPNEGLGLGLFIAAQIAQSHGGSLDVESGAQQTCFTFRMAPGASVERRLAPRL